MRWDLASTSWCREPRTCCRDVGDATTHLVHVFQGTKHGQADRRAGRTGAHSLTGRSHQNVRFVDVHRRAPFASIRVACQPVASEARSQPALCTVCVLQDESRSTSDFCVSIWCKWRRWGYPCTAGIPRRLMSGRPLPASRDTLSICAHAKINFSVGTVLPDERPFGLCRGTGQSTSGTMVMRRWPGHPIPQLLGSFAWV